MGERAGGFVFVGATDVADIVRDGLWLLDRLAAAEAELEAALKEGLELATTLSRWLRHHSTCARVTESGRCSCGLQEALAFLEPTMAAESRAALGGGAPNGGGL